MEYTEQEHARNLIKLLEDDNTCCGCPVPFRIRLSNVETVPRTGNLYGCSCENNMTICKEFIGVNSSHTDREMCPCNHLGKENAVKLTWIALEEKGYLDD